MKKISGTQENFEEKRDEKNLRTKGQQNSFGHNLMNRSSHIVQIYIT